jgi:hypothetical protein
MALAGIEPALPEQTGRSLAVEVPGQKAARGE